MDASQRTHGYCYGGIRRYALIDGLSSISNGLFSFDYKLLAIADIDAWSQLTLHLDALQVVDGVA